jgi:hypothetical protein
MSPSPIKEKHMCQIMIFEDHILKARAQNTKAKTGWHIHAYYLDACNCDWGCPCQFNAKPTHGNCDGLSGIHIINGKYGSDVKLDGLNMAYAGSWPGPLHEGHGKMTYYIDYRANDRQFDALSKIITGRAGDNGPFELYASITEEHEEPKRTRIRFQSRNIRSHVIIDSGDAGNNDSNKEESFEIDAWLEPIRNPVTGKAHRAIIELPQGVEATRMDQASTKNFVVNDMLFNFRYKGTYGSFSENTWKGTTS